MSESVSESVRHFLGLLPDRRVHDVRALHLVETEGGVLCLDVNLAAPTIEDLMPQVIATLRAYERSGSILPAAPEEQWMKIAGQTPEDQLRKFVLRDLKRPIIVVLHPAKGGAA